MVTVAVLFATTIPLLFLYAVRTLDLYGSGSPRAILLSFAWGLPAVALAALLSPRLAPAGGNLTVALLEELLKALVLLYLARRPSFTYFVDGAVYGFAVGIGFAVFENLLYITQHPAAGLSTSAGRVFSTNLMHASTSAVVGIALGLSRFRRFSWRALFLLAGLTLAVLIHGGFNRLVAGGTGQTLALYAIAAGLGGFAFVALAIRRGLAAQRRWIAAALGVADQVTGAEARAVAHLANADVTLRPLVALFGAEKAADAQRVLLLQARLGILRKTLDRAAGDGRLQEALTADLRNVRQEMDAARRRLGPYLMISLRSLFPEGNHALWSQIETTLQARLTAEGEEHSANLFTLLGERVADRDRSAQ